MGRIFLAAWLVALGAGTAGATASWKKHGMGNQGPKTLQAETFAVAKQTWFAVHGIFHGRSNLIRSKDGGVTWEATPGLSDKDFAQSVVARDGVVYVATTQGIYQSTDAGDKWTQIKKGMAKKKVTNLAAGAGTVVAVLDGTSLLCAERGGSPGSAGRGAEGPLKDKKGAWKWKRAKKGLPKTYDHLGDLAVSGKTVFVGVMIDDATRTAKVFRSTDNCKTFTPVMVGPTVKATDQIVIAGGVQGFAISKDQGASFSAVPSPTRQEGTYNFVVVGETVYAGLLDLEGPSAILRLEADLSGWERLSLPGVPRTKVPPVFMVEGPYVYMIANATDLYSIDARSLSASK